MNSKQRRQYRRAVDRLMPPGTRVMHKWRRDNRAVFVVRPRGPFERCEWNRVMVEREVKPFGYESVSPLNLVLAPAVTHEPQKLDQDWDD